MSSQKNLIWQVWRTWKVNLVSIHFLSFVLSWMLPSETLSSSLNGGDRKQCEHHCINATTEGQPRVWSVVLYSNSMNAHVSLPRRAPISPTNTQTNSINISKLLWHIERLIKGPVCHKHNLFCWYSSLSASGLAARLQMTLKCFVTTFIVSGTQKMKRYWIKQFLKPSRRASKSAVTIHPTWHILKIPWHIFKRWQEKCTLNVTLELIHLCKSAFYII